MIVSCLYRSLARRIRQNWLDEVEEQSTNRSHLSKRTTSDNLDGNVSAVIYFVLGDTTPYGTRIFHYIKSIKFENSGYSDVTDKLRLYPYKFCLHIYFQYLSKLYFITPFMLKCCGWSRLRFICIWRLDSCNTESMIKIGRHLSLRHTIPRNSMSNIRVSLPVNNSTLQRLWELKFQ